MTSQTQITNHLKRMLKEAMKEKKRLLELHLHELRAKYGVSEDKPDNVIVVDGTPSPWTSKQSSTKSSASSAPVNAPPGKYKKEALTAQKKRKRTEEDNALDFKICPPPLVKKKLSLRRKAPVIMVEASEEDEEDDTQSPIQKQGEGEREGEVGPQDLQEKGRSYP